MKKILFMNPSSRSSEDGDQSSSSPMAPKRRKQLTSEEQEQLRQDALIETQKMLRGEKIGRNYLFQLPCADCGHKTIGDGQKASIIRKCLVCRVRRGMNSYFRELLHGPTPFGECLRQFLHTSPETVQSFLEAGAEEAATGGGSELSPDHPSEAESSRPGRCSNENVYHPPAATPPLSAELKEPYPPIVISAATSKCLSSAAASNADLVSDGLKELIRHSGDSPALAALLLYIKDELCRYSLSHLARAYQASQASGAYGDAEDAQAEYRFVRHEVYEILSEYLHQEAAAEARDGAKTIPYISVSKLQRESLEYLTRQQADTCRVLGAVKQEVNDLKKLAVQCVYEKERLKRSLARIPQFRIPRASTAAPDPDPSDASDSLSIAIEDSEI